MVGVTPPMLNRSSPSPPSSPCSLYLSPVKKPAKGWPLVCPSFERRWSKNIFNGIAELPVLIDPCNKENVRGEGASSSTEAAYADFDEALLVLQSLFQTHLPDMAKDILGAANVKKVPEELAKRSLQGKLLWALVQHLQLLARGLDAYLPIGDQSVIFGAVDSSDSSGGGERPPEAERTLTPEVQASLVPASRPVSAEEKRRIKNLKRNLRRRGPARRIKFQRSNSNVCQMFESLHKADPRTSHNLLAELLGPSFAAILKNGGGNFDENSTREKIDDTVESCCWSIDENFPRVIAEAVASAAAPRGPDTISKMLRFPTRLCAFAIEVLTSLETKVADLAVSCACVNRWACIEYPAYSCGRFFSVDNGQLHACALDGERYRDSNFRIVHVDSWWSLEHLLEKNSKLLEDPPSVAVDCKGVTDNQTFTLSMLQLSFSHDPATVYIIDIHKLGLKVLGYGHQGLCLKAILEDSTWKKISFDARRDVHSLHHQMAVTMTNVIDLQILEIAARRSGGHHVKYVSDLRKAIEKHGKLNEKELEFSGKLIKDARALFDREYGGDDNVFIERPLHPKIMMYVAHDVRYLFHLHTTLDTLVHEKYRPAIIEECRKREDWWRNDTVTFSNTAPDF